MCALHIGSFGYEVNDVEYKWKADPPVSYGKFEMAQFKLKDTRSVDSNRRALPSSPSYIVLFCTRFCEVYETGNRKKKNMEYRNDSIASLEIMLERQTGYFLLGASCSMIDTETGPRFMQ